MISIRRVPLTLKLVMFPPVTPALGIITFLLSGDFNTWHWRQWRILGDMASDHGLTTLKYAEDHRKRVFGQPLDHIYVRGLHVVDATTVSLDSSDHNPMSATLSL